MPIEDDSPNVDSPDARGAGTALDHLGLEHDLYVFHLPILGSVRQYFLHAMFVDEKFARRHRSTATDSGYNQRILIGIGGMNRATMAQSL
jgi:hypothetical protein